MMNATELMPIAKTATLLATKLDYAGGDSAFCVFLPEPGVTLVAAMRDLQGGGLASLVAALQANETTDVALGLPKLDSDLSVDLATQLEQMGMPLAFDQGKADFSGMADAGSGNIFINRVLHKTKIKVDEKGTEAAAATAVEMGLTAAIEAPQPVRFTCDRPYLFAIVDQKSGAVLFLGAVGDPTK
jgi:serpin B